MTVCASAFFNFFNFAQQPHFPNSLFLLTVFVGLIFVISQHLCGFGETEREEEERRFLTDLTAFFQIARP
jgi:hypothetical protein